MLFRSLREFHEALRQNPNDYYSRYSLGNLLSKLGRVEEATAEYQRAIAADSERPEAHFNLAETYFERKQWEQGVAHYEAALAHELEPEVASTAHLRLGAFHTERRAWEKAEKHLLQAVDLGPEDFMTNYCLALVYLNIDWGESGWAARSKALLFAKKAMELDPEDEDAREVARAALAALEKARPPSQAASRQPIASPSRTWWQFWKR